MMQTDRMATAARGAREASPAGLAPVALSVCASAILGWLLLVSATQDGNGSERDSTAEISELSQVEPQDVANGLATMTGSKEFLAAFSRSRERCARPLAWVSIALAPGQPPGSVRIQSGSYFSPTFKLSATPLRVAIPYPGPYELGRGMLTVDDAGGRAVVALAPPWQMPAQPNSAEREVFWQPAKTCSAPHE